MKLSGYENYEAVISRMLEGPYWVIDLVPDQVPAGARGQYPAVERYFRQTSRMVKSFVNTT